MFTTFDNDGGYPVVPLVMVGDYLTMPGRCGSAATTPFPTLKSVIQSGPRLCAITKWTLRIGATESQYN